MPHFPKLPGPVDNEIKGYRCLDTVAHYLQHCAERAGVNFGPRHTPFDRVAADAAGVRLGKFKRLLERWHRLEAPVPNGYLSAIRVKSHTLIQLFEHDRDRFELIFGRQRSPRRMTLQLMPGVLQDVELPEGITESAAIAHAQTLAAKSQCRAVLINYPELLTIVVRGTQEVRRIIYAPCMRFCRDHVVFGKRGGAINGFRLH